MTVIRSLGKNHYLLRQLVRRELATRYRGSALGLAWMVIQPILLLAVFTLFFAGIFKARWSSDGDTLDFAFALFTGLIVHGILAEPLGRSPGVILQNVSYVKKMVFPIELLPVVPAVSAFLHGMLSLLMLVFAMIIAGRPPGLEAVLLPVILLPLLAAGVGVSLGLAAVGVYVRDIAQLTGLLVTLLLFLSPVFFPISALPRALQGVLPVNPLVVPIEACRAVLFGGNGPGLASWLVHIAVSVVLLVAGAWIFQRVRAGFADFL